VPRRHRPVVTLTIVCVPLGATFAGLLGIRVLPFVGWRTLFLIGGVVLVLGAVALLGVLPESPRCLAASSAALAIISRHVPVSGQGFKTLNE
jgi:AAHS family 4-hydroxybenzoate transporter-like MFS transporter